MNLLIVFVDSFGLTLWIWLQHLNSLIPRWRVVILIKQYNRQQKYNMWNCVWFFIRKRNTLFYFSMCIFFLQWYYMIARSDYFTKTIYVFNIYISTEQYTWNRFKKTFVQTTERNWWAVMKCGAHFCDNYVMW